MDAPPTSHVPAVCLSASQDYNTTPKALLVTSVPSLLQLHGGRRAQHGAACGCLHCPQQREGARVGQGRPCQEPACNPRLLSFPTMKGNGRSFGAEVEGNPLCGDFGKAAARGGRLFVPLRSSAATAAGWGTWASPSSCPALCALPPCSPSTGIAALAISWARLPKGLQAEHFI